jgi:hypothetical protein
VSSPAKVAPYTPADPQEVRPLPTDVKSIRDSVTAALATLQEGERSALVAHANLNGGEVFLIAKPFEHWSFVGYVGKKWGGPLQAEATVVLSW